MRVLAALEELRDLSKIACARAFGWEIDPLDPRPSRYAKSWEAAIGPDGRWQLRGDYLRELSDRYLPPDQTFWRIDRLRALLSPGERIALRDEPRSPPEEVAASAAFV